MHGSVINVSPALDRIPAVVATRWRRPPRKSRERTLLAFVLGLRGGLLDSLLDLLRARHLVTCVHSIRAKQDESSRCDCKFSAKSAAQGETTLTNPPLLCVRSSSPGSLEPAFYFDSSTLGSTERQRPASTKERKVAGFRSGPNPRLLGRKKKTRLSLVRHTALVLFPLSLFTAPGSRLAPSTESHGQRYPVQPRASSAGEFLEPTPVDLLIRQSPHTIFTKPLSLFAAGPILTLRLPSAQQRRRSLARRQRKRLRVRARPPNPPPPPPAISRS